jgi:hypothetical protein
MTPTSSPPAVGSGSARTAYQTTTLREMTGIFSTSSMKIASHTETLTTGSV